MIWMWMLFLWPIYVTNDLLEARGLPWWRRYAPSVFYGLDIIASWRGSSLAAPLWLAWFCMFWWNFTTSWRNRNNKRDRKKLGAAQQQLTQVQERSFKQQVAEAT